MALIDSKSGMTENEIYDAIFRARDAAVGVYVREVINLDDFLNNPLNNNKQPSDA